MGTSRRSFLAASALAGTAALPRSLLAAVEQATPALPALADWPAVRAQFALDSSYLHFAGFYIASHPAPVRAAIDAMRRALDANPFLTVENGMFESDADNMQRKVREDIAAYVGGQADEIALTGNTTAGLALVYHGLILKPGDEILVTVHDHVVHHEAVRLATERNGASVRKITLFDAASKATPDEILTRVRAGIRPATRVLGVTWVHSATGMRLPVRDIAAVVAEANRERDAADHVLLLVDGVHGLGSTDAVVADLGADFFCAGTHKWMFAPRGTGIVRAPAAAWARLRPLVPSFSDKELYDAWIEGRAPRGPTNANRVAPGGFHAYEHQWAMGSAFRMHLAMGRTRVAERIASLNARCRDGLKQIPGLTLHTPTNPQLAGGLSCFELAGVAPDEAVKRLLARKIIASTAPYAANYIRLSAGLMNTPEEVDRAVAAVSAVAKSKG